MRNSELGFVIGKDIWINGAVTKESFVIAPLFGVWEIQLVFIIK